MDGYTIKEASVALQMSTKTIYNYISNRMLDANKVNGRWIIDIESIRNLSSSKIRNNIEIIGDISNLLEKNIIVDREHYEGILRQIGKLKATEELLWEYKSAKEKLEYKVEELQNRLEEDRRSKGLWFKISGRKRN